MLKIAIKPNPLRQLKKPEEEEKTKNTCTVLLVSFLTPDRGSLTPTDRPLSSRRVSARAQPSKGKKYYIAANPTPTRYRFARARRALVCLHPDTPNRRKPSRCIARCHLRIVAASRSGHSTHCALSPRCELPPHARNRVDARRIARLSACALPKGPR